MRVIDECSDFILCSRWLESEHLSVEPGRRAAIAMWGEKTARVGGFDSLHTPALTQVRGAGGGGSGEPLYHLLQGVTYSFMET